VVVLEIRSILVRLLAEKGSGRPLMKHANQGQVSDTYRYLYIALSELWDFEKANQVLPLWYWNVNGQFKNCLNVGKGWFLPRREIQAKPSTPARVLGARRLAFRGQNHIEAVWLS
jgi:hypothetical protein